jgi:hypothetical protein
MRRSFKLIFIISLFIKISSIKAQTCNNPIDLPFWDNAWSKIDSFPQYDKWFRFEADASQLKIEVYIENYNSSIHNVFLYEDDCVNLPMLNTTINVSGDTLTIETPSLNIGDNYLIMIENNSGTYLKYNLRKLYYSNSAIMGCSSVTCFAVPNCEYVCNGSFECLNFVPIAMAAIYSGAVSNWTTANGGTSDIFTSSASFNSGVSVPCNIPSYSNPHIGNNYSGLSPIYVSNSNYESEYIQTKLLNPLTSGKTYSISFWVKKARHFQPIIEEFGIFLSSNQINNLNMSPITNYSISGSTTNTVLLNNYTTWQNIIFYYTAFGGEQFLTIGNTSSTINSTTSLTPPTTPTCSFAFNNPQQYILIDEVSLREVITNSTVSFSGKKVCSQEFTLLNSLATPTGGVFSGNGVTYSAPNYYFNAALAGVGTHTITYTLPVCSQNGMATAVFTVTNSNTLTVNSNMNTLCANLGQSATLTAAATISNSITYLWQPGNIIGNPISVNPSSTTIYTVSGNNLGCIGTATIAINSLSLCCNSTVTAFSGTAFPTTTLTGLTYTTPMVFNNDVEIPPGVNVTLSNAEFLFAPNTRITVKNGANLQIRGSHLYACGTDMWQGIVVENGGKLSTVMGNPNTNLIEDAITAIDVSGHTTSTLTGFGAILDVNQAVFNKNLVSIKISTYQTSASVYPFKIANSVFTCRSLTYTPTSWPNSLTSGLRSASNPTNGLAVPYLLQNFPFTYLKSPYNYMPSEMGIYINAVGTTTSTTYRNIQVGSTASTADYNIFDGLQESIVAIRSNLLSLNNVFQNTQRDNYFVPPNGPLFTAGGTAIRHENQTTFNTNLNITASSTNPAFGNRFYNCHRGIYLYNTYNFSAQYATFRSTQSSTNTAFNQGNSGVLAQTNRFSYIINNNNVANIANPIAVHIWADNYNFGTPQYGTYAAQLQIQNNYIGSQTTTAAGVTTQYVNQAIQLLSVVGNSFQAINSCAVITNTINRVYRGIEINNVSKTNYGVNTGTNVISLLNDNVFNASQNAIRYTNNASGTVRGNTVSAVNTTNTLVTLFYAGGCTNNPTVACNNLSNSWQAFEYNGPNSNVFWRGNKMNTHQRGLVLSNNGIIGTQGSSGNPIDNEYNGSWTGRYCTWTEGAATQASNSPMWVKSIGNLPFAPINNDGNPSGQSYISCCINNTTGSYNCGGSPPPSSMMMSSTSSLLPSTPNLNDDMSYIQNYANYSHIKNEGNISSLNQSYTTSFSNSSLDKFYHLNVMHYNGQTGSANVINTVISPTNAIEGNYKLFYELYGKFVSGNFNSQDQFNLDQLVLLCPGKQGAVVYQARALRSYITKLVFNYTDNCEEVKYSARENTTEGNTEIITKWNVELFPNPNQGNFNIVSKTPSEKLAISIMDVNGRTLHQANIVTENFVYILNYNLENGIYFITIENGNLEKTTKKMVVTK